VSTVEDKRKEQEKLLYLNDAIVVCQTTTLGISATNKLIGSKGINIDFS